MTPTHVKLKYDFDLGVWRGDRNADKPAPVIQQATGGQPCSIVPRDGGYTMTYGNYSGNCSTITGGYDSTSGTVSFPYLPYSPPSPYADWQWSGYQWNGQYYPAYPQWTPPPYNESYELWKRIVQAELAQGTKEPTVQPEPTEERMKNPGKPVIISGDGLVIDEDFKDMAAAVKYAKRLARKNDDEYYVYVAAKVVAPTEPAVEVTDAQ